MARQMPASPIWQSLLGDSEHLFGAEENAYQLSTPPLHPTPNACHYSDRRSSSRLVPERITSYQLYEEIDRIYHDLDVLGKLATTNGLKVPDWIECEEHGHTFRTPAILSERGKALLGRDDADHLVGGERAAEQRF